MALSTVMCACQQATGSASPPSAPGTPQPSWEPCPPRQGSETAGRVGGSGRPRRGWRGKKSSPQAEGRRVAALFKAERTARVRPRRLSGNKSTRVDLLVREFER